MRKKISALRSSRLDRQHRSHKPPMFKPICVGVRRRFRPAARYLPLAPWREPPKRRPAPQASGDAIRLPLLPKTRTCEITEACEPERSLAPLRPVGKPLAAADWPTGIGQDHREAPASTSHRDQGRSGPWSWCRERPCLQNGPCFPCHRQMPQTSIRHSHWTCCFAQDDRA